MTKERYESLRDGTRVWFHPSYFAYSMLGVIKTVNGERGIWVNFFGDGQCHFPDKNNQYGNHTFSAPYISGEYKRN